MTAATEHFRPTPTGIWRSRVFPGLWLDGQALLAGNLRQVLDRLQDGLRSPEHEQMFPTLHQRLRAPASVGGRSSWLEPRPLASEPPAAQPEKKSTLDRYAPCPCGSGKKFKFCCGATKPR